MVHMEDVIVIQAPVEVTFAVVADFKNTGAWHKNMKQVGFSSDAAVGAGSEYQWVETFMWKTLDLSGVVTTWDPPNGFTWRPHAGPFPMTGGWRFEAVGTATKVTRFSDTELTGLMRRMPGLMTRIAKRQVRGELADLKRLVELR